MRASDTASGASLTVGLGVVAEMVRLAAIEVPGVLRLGRGGPAWRGWGRRPIVTRRVEDGIEVRVWLVARPGHPLVPLAREVRGAVAATVERSLGLPVARVDLVVDGVGG
jgi:uncharacterized alkaline shock family protein YloU